jgi:DNA-binding transcriptional regulator YhcF (GntR family)
MEGWIKLHRKFLDWEWFKVDDMVKLFIYLLIAANFEEKKWRGITIKRGQILTGINSLNEATKISHQTLRTCLKRLENTGEITSKSTNKYTIITICNYDSYQELKDATNKQKHKQLTNDQQTTNKQLTTTKELKKDKKERKEYSPELIELNEKCKTYFDEKYITIKSLDCFDKLVRIDKYTINQIKQAILNAKADSFWSDNFLSPLKLREKDKSKVLYIDIFLKIQNSKKQFEPSNSVYGQ